MIPTKVIATLLAVVFVISLVAAIYSGSQVKPILNATSGGPPPYQSAPVMCGMEIEPFGMIECPSPAP